MRAPKVMARKRQDSRGHPHAFHAAPAQAFTEVGRSSYGSRCPISARKPPNKRPPPTELVLASNLSTSNPNSQLGTSTVVQLGSVEGGPASGLRMLSLPQPFQLLLK